MASKKGKALAELLGFTYMEKGGPFDGCGAVGLKEGFPFAVDWVKRNNKVKTVAFIMRFEKGSLDAEPQIVKAKLQTDEDILRAMGKKKFSANEHRVNSVTEDRIMIYWDYSMSSPKPEVVASAVEAIVKFMKDHAKPVGERCDQCGSSNGGTLFCLEGVPTMICGTCAEHVRSENMQKAREWEAVEPRPFLGILAGTAVAIAAALIWGGLAYFSHRIFVILALGIGFAIAWAIKLGMKKVTITGKVAAFVLTVASVIGGQFFFFILIVIDKAKVHLTVEVVRRVMPYFWEGLFSDSSGYLSVLCGVLGAIVALHYLRQKTPGRELVSVQQGMTV